MTLAEYWLPYAISQIVFLFLLLASWRWFFVARFFWTIIFLGAGIFNFYTASTQPEVYLAYADGALLSFYKNFILCEFSRHPAFYVKSIAIGQMLVGVLLMGRGKVFKLGCLGGIIFLLAIAPLGVGSALPATLIGAAALVLLWRHGAERMIYQRIRRQSS